MMIREVCMQICAYMTGERVQYRKMKTFLQNVYRLTSNTESTQQNCDCKKKQISKTTLFQISTHCYGLKSLQSHMSK